MPRQTIFWMLSFKRRVNSKSCQYSTTRVKSHPHWYQLLWQRWMDEESRQSDPTTLKYRCVGPPLMFFFIAWLAAARGRGGAARTPLLFFWMQQQGALRCPDSVLFRSACCSRKKMGPCFFSQNLLQEEHGGHDALPFILFRMFAAPGAKHPLTSSVQLWFRLSFCTPFWALHSSATNHATRFSMFFKTAWRTHFVVIQWHCSRHPFGISGGGIDPRTFPAGNVVLTTDILSSLNLKREVESYSLFHIQSEKGKIFKTLRQNNAVLRRAVLSERKQRWTELVRGDWRPAFAAAGRNGEELLYFYRRRGGRTFKSRGRLRPSFPALK